jgi:hypothetical protein
MQPTDTQTTDEPCPFDLMTDEDFDRWADDFAADRFDRLMLEQAEAKVAELIACGF